MTDLNPWLPELDPPAGGHARLAAALAGRGARAERHRRRAPWAWAGASLATALLVLTPWLRAPDADRLRAQRIASSLEQAWAAGGDSDLAVTDGAAIAVLRTPQLRLYWVDVVDAKASHSSNTPRPAR